MRLLSGVRVARERCLNELKALLKPQRRCFAPESQKADLASCSILANKNFAEFLPVTAGLQLVRYPTFTQHRCLVAFERPVNAFGFRGPTAVCHPAEQLGYKSAPVDAHL